MHRDPELTIIMTVYNGTANLPQAIESILVQSFDNFEFVIIDDASTDQSMAVIKSYDDSRIKLIENKKNMGQTKSLNIGLQLAKGKYIARIDQDDISMANRLEQQVMFMEQNPEIVLLGTAYQTIDANGNLLAHYCPPTDHQDIVNSFTYYCPFAHSSVMFRRIPTLKLGGYPEEYIYTQDFPLWLKLSSQYKVANLPEELVKIRKHNNQAGESYGAKSVISHEFLSLQEEALKHPRISSKAKRRGRRKMIRLRIDHAIFLWNENRNIMELNKFIKLVVRYPLSSVKYFMLNLFSIFFGTFSQKLKYKVKNHLFSLLPYKLNSKLHGKRW